MEARTAHDIRVDAQLAGVGLDETLRGLGRFLHYFAEMTEVATPGSSCLRANSRTWLNASSVSVNCWSVSPPSFNWREIRYKMSAPRWLINLGPC